MNSGDIGEKRKIEVTAVVACNHLQGERIGVVGASIVPIRFTSGKATKFYVVIEEELVKIVCMNCFAIASQVSLWPDKSRVS